MVGARSLLDSECMTTEQTTSASRATALRFFEHLYAGRLEDALDLLAPDALYTVMGKPDQFPLAGTYKKEQIIDLLGIVSQGAPHGASPSITKTIADGNDVAVMGHVEAVGASGRNYSNDFVFLVTFRDDLIVAVDEYIDTQHANDVLFSA